MVNYEQAIKKPFTDLTKLLIGTVLSIIPIIHWFVRGFAIESSGLGNTKPSPKMPEWKNWKNLFVKGLAADIILLIYAIPGIILLLIGAGYLITSLAGTMPLNAGNMGAMMRQLFLQSWTTMLPMFLTAAPILLVGIILLAVASYIAPIAVLNYVKSKKFSAAFELGKITKKAFTGNYFIVWIVIAIITVILSAVLEFIPFIGNALTFFITGVMAYSLYGQVYREV